MSGRTFLDSNILVYSVDESPAEKPKHDRAVELLSVQPENRAVQISLWDALIVEAASRAGCERVLSEDLDAGQAIRGVRIENPFA